MKHRYNNGDRGKSMQSEETLFYCLFVCHKSHMAGLELNLELRGESPATNPCTILYKVR
jgi:hypothetical protein